MNAAALNRIIQTIIGKARKLHKKYISARIGKIDYVGIFPVSIQEKLDYETLMNELHAKPVYRDDDGVLYQILRTHVLPHHLIKICNAPSRYNPSLNKIGYVDFQTEEYAKLKEAYKTDPAVTFLYGDTWEIFCLAQPDEDVSVYIPNIPLSRDLGL